MDSQILASKEGYTRKEIVIPLEELIRVWELDGAIRISWFSAYRFAYLRVGGHYAKLFFNYNGSNGRAESADYGSFASGTASSASVGIVSVILRSL